MSSEPYPNGSALNFSDPELQEKIRVLASKVAPKEGRPLEELIRSTGRLKGHEALRLWTWFSSHRLDPIHDLDEHGRAIFEGDLLRIKADWYGRLSRLLLKTTSEESAREAAAQDVYVLHWGEMRVPIFHLVLLSTLINSEARPHHLMIVRWLVDEVKLPVDGEDMSGSTALYHALSTKPAFDPDFAQILYDAGGDVNHQNRFGATAAHEITLIWEPQNEEIVQRAADALEWYLSHGGNIDIKDNDGLTARMCVNSTRKLAKHGVENMPTWDVVEKDDRRRHRLKGSICTFCGRAPEGTSALFVCSRCKKAIYCPPPRRCQKADWSKHRLSCKSHRTSDQGSKYFGISLDE